MQPLARSLAIVAMLLPVAAHAETLPILERTLEFEPPNGYCLLDRSDPDQSRIFDFMAGQQRRGNIELLAMYALCGETQAIIDGAATNVFNYGMLVVLPADGVTIAPIPGYSRAEVFELVQANMPRFSTSLEAGIDEAREQLAESGVSLSTITEPTVIGADDNAVYVTSTMQIDAGDGPTLKAGVGALTFVAELPLASYLYAPADDDAYEALFDIQVELMEDFVAANE